MRQYMLWLAIISGLLPVFGSTMVTNASAEECAKVLPSHSLQYKSRPPSKTGLPTDAGVVAPGFVAPKDAPTTFGISVSKYQADVDFIRAKACGAAFAFVRLSAETESSNESLYRQHWRNAKAVGLLVAPVHNLSLFPAGARNLLKMSQHARAESIKKLTNLANTSHVQSRLFLARLDEVLASDPIEEFGGTQGRLYLDPVVDLTYDPLVGQSTALRDQYTPVVQSLVCNFIDQIDSGINASFDVIMVTPSIWRGYHLDDAPCDLKGKGIALVVYESDGDEVSHKAEYKDICDLAGRNVCRFDLYSSYSGFLSFDKKQLAGLLRYHGAQTELGGHIHARQ